MIESEITVSICMITYNHEDFIAQAIEGVIMQKSNFKFELVIGEDCSKDNTRQICLEYQNKYPNLIRLLLPSDNLGMSQNFRHTMKACTGKYIAFCEGDDYWTDSDKLQKQVDFLEKNTDCTLCCHMVGRYNYETCKEEKFDFVDESRYLTNEEIILAHGKKTPTLSFVFRSELVREIPNWVWKAPVGDIPLVYFLMMNGTVFCFSDNMGIYRSNVPNSWSVSQQNISILKSLKFRIRFVAFIQSFNLYSNFKYKKELTVLGSQTVSLKDSLIQFLAFLYRVI